MEDYELDGLERHFKKMRVLIADDSSAMLHILRSLLAKIGFETIEVAKDGEKAWEILNGDSAVDLVFADLKMPRLSGIRLLAKLRASEKLREIPFIIISSEAGTESILEAGRHNATAYIVKPFSIEKIVYVLKKIFASRFHWTVDG